MNKQMHTLIVLVDTLIEAARSLRREIVLTHTMRRDLMCGLWMRDASRVSFRIWKDGDRYMVEERFGNEVNQRRKIFSGELLEDEGGNLYIGTLDRAIGYDEKNDRLIVETFGVFERQKNMQDEK